MHALITINLKLLKKISNCTAFTLGCRYDVPLSQTTLAIMKAEWNGRTGGRNIDLFLLCRECGLKNDFVANGIKL